MDGETSQFPRGFMLNLRPLGDPTKLAFKRVQRNHDWLSRNIFQLEATRQDDRLQLEGVDAEVLPPGRYELEMRLSGMQFVQAKQQISIRKNQSKVVRFREKPAKQKLALNRPIDSFDRESVRILRHKKSLLDGTSAEGLAGESSRTRPPEGAPVEHAREVGRAASGPRPFEPPRPLRVSRRNGSYLRGGVGRLPHHRER